MLDRVVEDGGAGVTPKALVGGAGSGHGRGPSGWHQGVTTMRRVQVLHATDHASGYNSNREVGVQTGPVRSE